MTISNHGAATSYASFLQAQTKEYQDHTTRLKELKLALEHQMIIQSNKIIPKQYQPKQLKTFDSALSQEFNQKFSTLFFQQLDKVITSNTIKVKLTECTLTSIVTQTEKYLSTLALPTQEICLIYDKFVSDCQINHHTPLPELQTKLQQNRDPDTCTPGTHTKRRRPKRKNPTPTPPSSKYSKQDPFLSPGPSQPQTWS